MHPAACRAIIAVKVAIFLRVEALAGPEKAEVYPFLVFFKSLSITFVTLAATRNTKLCPTLTSRNTGRAFSRTAGQHQAYDGQRHAGTYQNV